MRNCPTAAVVVMRRAIVADLGLGTGIADTNRVSWNGSGFKIRSIIDRGDPETVQVNLIFEDDSRYATELTDYCFASRFSAPGVP